MLAVASAFLGSAAQNFGWGAPLTLVALVPLLLAIERGGFWAVWLRLWLFYSVYLILSLNWLRLAGPGTEWLLPITMVYSGIFILLPASAMQWGRSAGRRWLLFAIAWTLMELLERTTLFGINWNLLGLPLADVPVLAQAASLGGPETLTLLALAVNAGLALVVLGRRSAGAALAAGTLCVWALFGWVQLSLSAAPEATVRAAVVQPMISQRVVWTAANRGPMLAKLNGMIDAAARRRPDLIVLPEWAVMGAPRYDAELAGFATGAVRRSGVPVLLGTGDVEGGRYYNAGLLIDTDNRVFWQRKMRLIPFLEYTPRTIPYSPPGWVRFSPGGEPGVFHLLPDVNLAVMICLEDSLPDLARTFAHEGATLLLALVNTENFAGTPEALQHLRRARLTAIAVGLPMVRAANSGVSCAIDSRGRVLGRLAPDRALVDVVRAPIAPIGTLYRWLGDWLAIGAAAAFVTMRLLFHVVNR